MGIIILVIIILIAGINLGFLLGFSRAMREAANNLNRPRISVFGPFAAVFGGVGLLIALGFGIYSLHFTLAAARTNGTVIEMQSEVEKQDDSTITSYAPTFRFQDAAGVQHTVSSSFFQSPPGFHVGDAVVVLYLPNHPQTAHIDDFWELWGFPAFGGILGAVLLLVGLIVMAWPKWTARFKKLPQPQPPS